MLILATSIILINLTNITIVQNTTPFFTLVLASFTLQQSLTIPKVLCCVGCLFGIIIMIDPSLLLFWNNDSYEQSPLTAGFLLGNFLMLWWSINRALINVMLKKGEFTSGEF